MLSENFLSAKGSLLSIWRSRETTSFISPSSRSRTAVNVAVRAARQDREETTAGALVAGYTRGWHEKSSVQPTAVSRNGCHGQSRMRA